MNALRFDGLTRAVSTLHSRRTLAGALGLTALGLPMLVKAKNKKSKKNKRKKQVKFNDFGCVDVGRFCKTGDQCCSGICASKTCQAHDTSTCQPGQHEAFCGGQDISCATPGGALGLCEVTTGNAPFCFGDGACFPCAKDADCVPFCGPSAACLRCVGCLAENGAQTLCASPVNSGCTFPPA